MTINVQWVNHATFKITDGITIYIDPWKCRDDCRDGDVILVSHSHYDHFCLDDIAQVAATQGQIIASADVISQLGRGLALAPNETLELTGLKVTGVPAYNPNKKYHPAASQWLGFVLEIAGKTIYYAGDTDEIPEMQSLQNIDLALMPVGGAYTMTAAEAAGALKLFNPAQAVPYHWGDIVGSHRDASEFSTNAPCPVTILQPGESLSL